MGIMKICGIALVLIAGYGIHDLIEMLKRQEFDEVLCMATALVIAVGIGLIII